LAHHVILRQRNISVAFGAKRTSNGGQNRLDRARMTDTVEKGLALIGEQ
jgi:hypothetical protein